VLSISQEIAYECGIANFGVKAQREWVTHITIDQTNCCAVADTPARSTSIHPDRRNGDGANERENGSLPGDIHAHGASSRRNS
jgi:hypothetical protein